MKTNQRRVIPKTRVPVHVHDVKDPGPKDETAFRFHSGKPQDIFAWASERLGAWFKEQGAEMTPEALALLAKLEEIACAELSEDRPVGLYYEGDGMGIQLQSGQKLILAHSSEEAVERYVPVTRSQTARTSGPAMESDGSYVAVTENK